MKTFLSCCMAVLLIGFPGGVSSLPLRGQESARQKPGGAGTAQPGAAPEARRAAPTFAFGLEDATPIKIKLARELSSAHEKTGDRVDFEVSEDIKVKDIVVIPKGGIAWGTITEAQPHRRMGRSGKLDMKINEVRLADGERIPLRAVREARGGGRQGVMTGAMVASGILFFPAAPLFLFVHGRDITIPKGAEVTAYIEGDTALDAQKFANSPPPPAAPAVPASTPAPQAVADSAPPTPSATPASEPAPQTTPATPATPPPMPATNDVEGNPPR
jgi:hypothetical protein